VGALEFGVVGEGDGEWARPWMGRKVELLDGGRVSERDVGSAVSNTWGWRGDQLCSEGEMRRGGFGPSGIPDSFWLGTVGIQSPVSLGLKEGDHICRVFTVTEVGSGVGGFGARARIGVGIWCRGS